MIPSLSACLIVQNAERLLAIALESLGEIYDELIIVDGGSVDATCDIAKQFGATLIHSPWPHDYAQQRNVYLDAAKTDWIVSIDSDEFIDVNTLHFLQQIKQGEQFASEVFFWPRRWISPHSLGQYITSAPHGDDAIARLFRPAGLRYQSAIHERLFGVLKPAEKLDVGLYHLDLFVSSIEQRAAKVAKYGAENPQHGAAEFYLPDQNSLRVADWLIDTVLPAVADRLRQLDPNLPRPKQLFSSFPPERRSSSAYIIFPDWRNLTAAAFAELMTVLEMAALETESIDLYVAVREVGDRLVTATLTNLLTELRLTCDLELPPTVQIVVIPAQMQPEILALQPIKLTLNYEDAEAAAFADQLTAWPIDWTA